jgi:hypothetical protein
LFERALVLYDLPDLGPGRSTSAEKFAVAFSRYGAGGNMSEYDIDRARLDDLSTEEIVRILRQERDDYTPEAISVFREILAGRGYADDGSSLRASTSGSRGTVGATGIAFGDVVRSPTDAIRVLNGVLTGVLDGSVEPQVAQAATNVVTGILHALEQEYMTGSREES